MNNLSIYWELKKIIKKNDESLCVYFCLSPIGVEEYAVILAEIFKSSPSAEEIKIMNINLYSVIDNFSRELYTWDTNLTDAINRHDNDFENT